MPPRKASVPTGKQPPKVAMTPPPAVVVKPKRSQPAKIIKAPAPNYEQEEEQLTGLPVLMKYGILALICAMAFFIRLFAVVRYESVIHEFDPYFNFRTTKYLVAEGFLDFLDWFDDRGWYPLGRTIGGTIYPGLMATAACFYWILQALHITINIRNVCVFLAPLFAANTAIASYLLTTEVTKRSSTGLLAAAFTAIVPSYISRSVGGSYDNEGVAIFALVFVFYLWIKAVNTGSMAWAAAAALGYFYMVAAWGGFVFIINIIPIYALVMVVGGRYSSRLYVAYTTFYVLGSLLAMQVPFVGFNVVKQAECAASHGMFIALQAIALGRYLLTAVDLGDLKRLFISAAVAAVGAVAAALVTAQLLGFVQWSGRSLTLLDPTYASKFMPIIASVSEHQPPTWTAFFFDLHLMVPLAPVGLFLLFRRPTDAAIFVIIYGTLSWYFAGVMVRLMLTLAPAACILGAIGLSELLQSLSALLAYGDSPLDGTSLSTAVQRSYQRVRSSFGTTTAAGPSTTAATSSSSSGDSSGTSSSSGGLSRFIALVLLLGATAVLAVYGFHSSYVSSLAYSNPSIVVELRGARGARIIYDDYREAYYWLRHNTAPDAKIMSWWDYGYQMSAMSNRTVIVDNNTWNNTHIATVGKALASTEEDAYPIMQSLDVDYVLVIFGGVANYASDDINKFLWPVRIGSGVFGKDMPSEKDFMSESGQFDVGPGGSKILHNCLAYKLSYYRFADAQIDRSRPRGFDFVRQREIGNKDFALTTMEEAFTSEHWLVRIYKVLPQPNLEATAAGIKASGGSTARSSASAPPAAPEIATRLVGCFTSENVFGGKVYVGGASGAQHAVIREQAAAAGKRYFATARNDVDGHGFLFDVLLPAPAAASAASGGGCERPCADNVSKQCGCMDSTCSGPKPAEEEHNRRWVVYELSA